MKYHEFFGRPQKSNTGNKSSNENQVSEPSQNVVVLNSVDEVRFMDQFSILFTIVHLELYYAGSVRCKGKKKGGVMGASKGDL